MSAIEKAQRIEDLPTAARADPFQWDSRASTPGQVGEIPSIDLARLVALFRRRLRLFSLVALSVLTAAVLATLLTTPKYTATAQVMLDPRQEKVTANSEVVPPLPADSAMVDSEVDVLRSPQLAGRVVSGFRLDQDPEFKPRKGLGRTTPPPEKARQAVVDSVARRLTVDRDGLTYVIRVRFTSEEPAKAARIANAFTELYIAEQLETKAAATRQTAAWLSGRLNHLRAQVLTDEDAVQQFKIANNLMSASGATLTEQEISTYNESLAQAQAQVAEDAARLGTARSQLAKGSSGDDVGETLDSRAIQKLKEDRAEASKRVASLRSQFQDAYPPLTVARAELADLDAQIDAETQRIISNLDAKLQVSRQRAGAIQATLAGTKGQLASNNRAVVALNELERTAQASRALYETYLARYKEASAQEGLHRPDARIVSLAPLPTSPSSPNLPLNLAAGAVLAIGAGLGAIALAEMMDARVNSSAEVEKRFRIRYLGAIPMLGSVARLPADANPVDYVVAHPFSGFAEAFRSLRTTIRYGGDGSPVKVVAVTSALPGEGKTTAAVCLGRLAALQGAKVMIVDCDFRRRNKEGPLNLRRSVGLIEVLERQATLDEAIIRDSETGADILPLAQARQGITPKDVFGDPELERLLANLKGRYDLIVLDTAPILAVADTRVLARKADFVLFVARWRGTPAPAIEGALRLLSGSKVEVNGFALNQVDMEHGARISDGDPSFYYNYTKNYYLEASE